MRKHALVRFLAFHVGALTLLLLLGTVAHQSISRRPAVLLFEPSRLPGAHVEKEVEGGSGQNSPLPAPRGRAPKPVKRRGILPPMVA
jgi:hypothetical protein